MAELLITASLDASSASAQNRPGKGGIDAGASPFATLLGAKVNQQAAKNDKSADPAAGGVARPLKERATQADATQSAAKSAATTATSPSAPPNEPTQIADETETQNAGAVVDLLAQVLAAAGNPVAGVAVEAVAKVLGSPSNDGQTEDGSTTESSGALADIQAVSSAILDALAATTTPPAVAVAAPLTTAVAASVAASVSTSTASAQSAIPVTITNESPLPAAASGGAPGAPGAIAPAVAAANSAESGGSGFKGSDESPGNGAFAQLLAHAQPEGGIGQAVAAQVSTQRVENIVLQHPAGEVRWQNELGDKLVWMAGAQRQQADLVLNPPQLGRIEVSLSVSGDQANAVFTSPNAAVREMLENSLPRLREIMSGAGIELGDAQINSGSSQQNNNAPGEQRRNEFRPLLADADQPVQRLADTPKARILTGRGLVDTFV